VNIGTLLRVEALADAILSRRRLKYLQGCFGCSARVRYEGKTIVVKSLDINHDSFKWVMREELFGYQLHHPNIAQLLSHYLSPYYMPSDDDFSVRCSMFFVQDDCGESVFT
jgi:predicted component of viral defense system (DUF524 family)